METIQAHMIFEVLGRPPENVKKALAMVVKQMSEEKGVKIVNHEIHEPIAVEDTKNLFTSFAEVEVELESIENYLGILFAYLPSNIEITKPENIALTNSQLNEIGSNLVQRLHNYDAITKKSMRERDAVVEELKKSAPEAFKRMTTPLEEKPGPPKKKTAKKTKKKKSK